MNDAPRRTTGLPQALRHAPFGVIRPRDLDAVYVNPRAEVARLVGAGILAPLGAGHYAIVPREHVASEWKPTLETAALGIGIAKAGAGSAVLVGISAARVLGAVPRAIGVAVVGVPVQARPITLVDDGRVIFTVVDAHAIAAQRNRFELGHGLVATAEQTALDLAHRPDLGGMPDVADEAIRALVPRCDPGQLAHIAQTQRRGRALGRLRRIAGDRA